MGQSKRVTAVMNERAVIMLEIIRKYPEGIVSRDLYAELKLHGITRKTGPAVIAWLIEDNYITVEKVHNSKLLYKANSSDQWCKRKYVPMKRKDYTFVKVETVIYTDLPDELARFTGQAKRKPEGKKTSYKIDNFKYMSSGQTGKGKHSYGVSPIYGTGEF